MEDTIDDSLMRDIYPGAIGEDKQGNITYVEEIIRDSPDIGSNGIATLLSGEYKFEYGPTHLIRVMGPITFDPLTWWMARNKDWYSKIIKKQPEQKEREKQILISAIDPIDKLINTYTTAKKKAGYSFFSRGGYEYDQKKFIAEFPFKRKIDILLYWRSCIRVLLPYLELTPQEIDQLNTNSAIFGSGTWSEKQRFYEKSFHPHKFLEVLIRMRPTEYKKLYDTLVKLNTFESDNLRKFFIETLNSRSNIANLAISPLLPELTQRTNQFFKDASLAKQKRGGRRKHLSKDRKIKTRKIKTRKIKTHKKYRKHI